MTSRLKLLFLAACCVWIAGCDASQCLPGSQPPKAECQIYAR